MKQYITSLLSFLILSYSVQSQTICGTDRMVQQAYQNEPVLEQNYNDLISWAQENESLLQGIPEGGTFVIPVVVHVIHNYGSENISDAQIEDGIRILNEDFQRTNADTSDVVALFKPIIGVTGFEFRLAKLDPNGNCTNGITRTVSALTYEAGDDVKSLISWPRNKYFNIWVVNQIDNGNEPGITAGYAYLPGTAPSSTVDGVILDHRYIGGIGASNGSNFSRRTLTHEAGHWFGLLHPWGNGSCGSNCGSDNINDTPTTSGACNNCNLTQNFCGGGVDNVQNYMDYASCSKMFTLNQSSRMQTVINSSVSGRNNLWTNANRIATGTTDGFTNNCVPKADFSVNRFTICAGSSIAFKDCSWNATPTSWNWTITDGVNNLSSTQQNPAIVFPNPGVYQVTLAVTAPGGSDTRTKTSYIYVFDAQADDNNYIYIDEFNAGPLANDRWLTPYSENPAQGWQETTLASYSQPNALRIPNFNATAGRVYNLISPSYDFTDITGTLHLNYKIAFANRTSGLNQDEMKVYLSSNCGQTWTLRKTYSIGDLATSGSSPSSWAPTQLSQWRTDSITGLTPWATKDNVRIRFEFFSGGGNNLYLDDLNIHAALGVESLGKDDLGLSVFPNPAQDNLHLAFSINESFQVQVLLRDITGRTVYMNDLGELGPNAYDIPITLSDNFPSGMYFIDLQIDGRSFTEKILIE